MLTLFSMLAYQPNAFLAFSLPLLSHHLFPSSFAVGPHRRSLSPGPHVTKLNFLIVVECLVLAPVTSPL